MFHSNKVGPCFAKNESKARLHTRLAIYIRICLALLYHTKKDRLDIFLHARDQTEEGRKREREM
jgi:hypothetical protein